ncbi:MAG: hypothetical protein WCW02_02695 [Candidatus Buchananbacteria bacterium]
MPTNKGKILLNNILWGLALWLFGYILGFIFYAFIPQQYLGWAIMPFGLVVTLWVLIKKIEREQLMCYFGVGVIWTVIAVAMDYFGIVKLLGSTNYYKLDVYFYYALTFILPIIVGWYKFRKNNSKTK